METQDMQAAAEQRYQQQLIDERNRAASGNKWVAPTAPGTPADKPVNEAPYLAPDPRQHRDIITKLESAGTVVDAAIDALQGIRDQITKATDEHYTKLPTQEQKDADQRALDKAGVRRVNN